MGSNFIVNRDKFLDEVIKSVMRSSNKMDFLIGYFYFSGFDLIADSVKEKNIRILVGMDIDPHLKNKVIEFNYITEQDSYDSDDKIRVNYIKNIISCYQTDEFDDEKHVHSFKLFLEKLKNGTLEVRKTLKPNHAKVYIFTTRTEDDQAGTYKGTVITGSSNFTFSGLKERDEVNVVSRQNHDFEMMSEYFNNLWIQATPLFNKDNFDFLYNEIKDHIPLLMCPKPYLLYIKAIYEYFNIAPLKIKLPSEITDNKYSDFKYQSDAIMQAIDIINRHNGVIVADVVGLGKSIIGSAVANNLNIPTIIITPPHLKPQWEEYRRMFNINAEIYTSGLIENANRDYMEIKREHLVIIDEAHKYRNEESSTYGSLWSLCQGNKVMLLTATPFNNRPEDIFSMLKLFQIPSKSTIMSVDNLYYELKQIINEHNKIKKDQKELKNKEEETIQQRINNLSKKIKYIIEPIVIRRTRIDLEKITEYKKDLDNQGIVFPKILDPILLEYNLGKLAPIYLNTLNRLTSDEKTENGLTCASYKPLLYVKDLKKYEDQIKKDFGDLELFKQTQRQLAGFMKTLLVRRFESSVDAFGKTLKSIKKGMSLIKEYSEKLKFIPVTKAIKTEKYKNLLEPELFDFFIDDDELGDMFSAKISGTIEEMRKDGVLMIDAKDINPDFFKDIDKDLKLLDEIESEWFKNYKPIADPKLDTLKLTLKNMIEKEPNRKVVIFSEFGDTVQYIFDQLKDDIPTFKYTSKDATDYNKEIIRSNFDVSYDIKKQKNQFKIIIATDAISEGYNLNRAGTIINYDIPYNPTRVIQRIGRINRINKKMFDELYIYNFFPTEIGEEEVSIKKISTLKIALIQAILGGDTKTLTKDEELREFMTKQYKESIEEVESWDVAYKNIIDEIKYRNPKLFEEVKKLPNRMNIQRKDQEGDGILSFAKKGDDLVFKIMKDKDVETLDYETGFGLLKAEISEDGYPVSIGFYNKYNELKKQLFKKATVVQKDKGINEALLVIEALIKKHSDHKEYLKELKMVIAKWDAISDYHGKFIRKMKDNPDDISKLLEILPPEVISKIKDRVKRLDEMKETVIITEEFVK